MYVGAVLIPSGVAILLGTVGPMLVVQLFVVVLQLGFVRLEERFGDEYRRCQAAVPRWL